MRAIVGIALLVTFAAYAMGVRALRSRHPQRGVRTWEVASFLSGGAVLALALLSPLHEVSEELFSAHMVQHELLMVVAAPLLVLGRPSMIMLWALPLSARQSLGRLSKTKTVSATLRVISRPFDAWLLHTLMIWIWHIPVLFQSTLRSEALHALQHGSFIGSALLFWWVVIYPHRNADLGLSIIALFTTAVHTAVLGALMTFARTPWYPDYGSGGAVWHMTPVEDQQLAGLVMWIPASVAYLFAALIIMRRWLRDAGERVAHHERPILNTKRTLECMDVAS
jgi:putative membrane protein